MTLPITIVNLLPSRSPAYIILANRYFGFDEKMLLTGPANPAPQKAPPVKNETTIPLTRLVPLHNF